MGSYFSNPIDNSLVVTNIVQNLEKTRIEREIAFSQLLERRKLAFKIAEEREKLNWLACGGGLVVVLSVLSSFHHRNLLHILPIFPVASFLGYKTDFCYGDQLIRIDGATRQLLDENIDNLVPLPPTIEDIKKRQEQLKQIADDERF